MAFRPVRLVLSYSRFLIAIPALGAFLAATLLLIYGGALTLQLLVHVLDMFPANMQHAKMLALDSIEIVDLFLLGTVLYIIALGLYELFIDDQIEMPTWLEFHNLDDLKHKLVGVIIPVLAVRFLGQVMSWDGQRDLLAFGAGNALIIVALTYFLLQKKAKSDKAVS